MFKLVIVICFSASGICAVSHDKRSFENLRECSNAGRIVGRHYGDRLRRARRSFDLKIGCKKIAAGGLGV